MKYSREGRRVCGVGINDADYQFKKTEVINGKRAIIHECEIYNHWKRMIYRCYSQKFKDKRPTYSKCSLFPEWLVFSNFKKWAENLNYKGMQLDKDILGTGVCYSPEFCAFVSSKTNSFILDCAKSRGEYPVGVYLNRRTGKYAAACRNPFTRKKEGLGYFDCPDKAHLTWKRRKHELSCQLAEIQTDQRVAEALRTRYL